MAEQKQKLSVLGLGLAIGIVWGAALVIIAWLAAAYGYAGPVVKLISSVYIGYGPTFFKGIIGGLWGLVDGFIGGAIVAMIYNWIVCRPREEE
ncbi:bacteriophage holin [Piscirickettsia litoralis]|uniref:Membrane-associated protein n=1 Tax=Piscirickettsia litoralis TaxID=1891921 RepID=A0ABX2ZZM0_9GAMM|nr:bacteriophage holin [Piscirickettsia litoralis]ODN42041.1 hypothetical protein BGC07_02550 [Piscirickettsia litoralis]